MSRSAIAPGTPIAYRPGASDATVRDPEETWFGFLSAVTPGSRTGEAAIAVFAPDGRLIMKQGVSQGGGPGQYRPNAQPQAYAPGTRAQVGWAPSMIAGGLIGTGWTNFVGFGIKNPEKHAVGIFKFDFEDEELNSLSSYDFLFVANAIGSGAGGDAFAYPSSQGGQRAIKCEDAAGTPIDAIVYFGYFRLPNGNLQSIIQP